MVDAGSHETRLAPTIRRHSSPHDMQTKPPSHNPAQDQRYYSGPDECSLPRATRMHGWCTCPERSQRDAPATQLPEHRPKLGSGRRDHGLAHRQHLLRRLSVRSAARKLHVHGQRLLARAHLLARVDVEHLRVLQQIPGGLTHGRDQRMAAGAPRPPRTRSPPWQAAAFSGHRHVHLGALQKGAPARQAKARTRHERRGRPSARTPWGETRPRGRAADRH